MTTTVVKLKIKPGREAAFELIITKLVADSNKHEPGIRFYQAFRSGTPGEYWMLESFVNQEALDAHRAADHFQALRPALGETFDGPPEMVRLTDI